MKPRKTDRSTALLSVNEAKAKASGMDDSTLLEWVDVAPKMHSASKTAEQASYGRITVLARTLQDSAYYLSVAGTYAEATEAYVDVRDAARQLLHEIASLGAAVNIGWRCSEATRGKQPPAHMLAQLSSLASEGEASDGNMSLMSYAAILEARDRGLIEIVEGVQDQQQQAEEPPAAAQEPEKTGGVRAAEKLKLGGGGVVGPDSPPAVEDPGVAQSAGSSEEADSGDKEEE